MREAPPASTESERMSPDELRLTALRPIRACSLTSHGHRAQTAEIRLAGPEASLHTDVVADMLALLEAIANGQCDEEAAAC